MIETKPPVPAVFDVDYEEIKEEEWPKEFVPDLMHQEWLYGHLISKMILLPFRATTAQTIAKLIAARGLIEQGWIKGRAKRKVGLIHRHYSYCIIGALYESDSGPGDSAHHALYDVVGPIGIVTFNDQPSTTKQDVLNAFDKAIANLKGDLA